MSSSTKRPRKEGDSPTTSADLDGATVTKFTNCRVLRNGQIRQEDLWVQNGKIIDPEKRFWQSVENREFAANVVIDCHNLILAPGFIDVQLNGAFGVDFSSTALTEDGVRQVARQLLRSGCTAFCPTLVTSTSEVYHATIEKLQARPGTTSGAEILGAHLEGPFMSEHKFGAHNAALLRSPVEGFETVKEVYGEDNLKHVRIVTMAPELEGATMAIKGLRQHGVVVSAGHSAATIDQALAGVAAGITKVTHMFNAMNAFHHRDPGLVGLLGSNIEGLFYGLIADGIHCHQASALIAYRSDPQGVILVTDAIAAMGLEPGRYKLGTMDVDITDRATIVGTDTLAGAIAPMDVCVRNFKSFTGCDTACALEAASLHPAQVLELSSKGRLDCGCDADIVFLNDQLELHGVYMAGECAWMNSGSTTVTKND